MLDEGAHEFLLLHLSGGIVDFIEGQKQVIDVVSCDLLLMNVINLTLDFSELGFHVLNQFILLIVTPLQIQRLTVIIGIIKVQCVHLVLQTRFRTESLAELRFDCFRLMLQLAGIDCGTDFLFDGIYEAWVVNHSRYDGCDHLIDFVLFNVQPERTFVSSLPFDALAEVVVTSFVILAVSLRDISVQIPSTAGAFQNAGKNMCVVWVADLFTPPCGTLTLGLCKIPVVLGNDGFMLTDIDGKLRLLHNVHFVSSAEFLFNLAATKCNLTAVNGKPFPKKFAALTYTVLRMVHLKLFSQIFYNFAPNHSMNCEEDVWKHS